MLLCLTINGRHKSFGYYADEIEAAKAYDRVAKKYRGEYAFLNFPKKWLKITGLWLFLWILCGKKPFYRPFYLTFLSKSGTQ